MSFVNRLDALLKSKNLTRKEFLEIMKFGKNQITYWEKNNTLPNHSTLSAIATYFGVSVEYLTGIEGEEEYANRITNLVVEWLIDNDYEYHEDINFLSIGKNGEYIFRTMGDFTTECMAIKKISEDGFELAMLDWERKNFAFIDDSHHNIINESRNVINDSPNATLTVTDTDLSKQERELIEMYRKFSLEEQLNLIAYALKVKKGEV